MPSLRVRNFFLICLFKIIFRTGCQLNNERGFKKMLEFVNGLLI